MRISRTEVTWVSSEPCFDTESIGAVLRRRDPDDVLIVTGDNRRLTAQDALARSAAMAAALTDMGVRHGDRVAVLHDLSADALLLWWALSRLGAVYLPLNPTWTARLAGRVIVDRRPTLLVAEPRHRALADVICAGTTTLVVDAHAVTSSSDIASFEDFPTDPLEDCCVVHNSGRPGIDHGVRGSWRQFAVMGGSLASMHPRGRMLVAAPPCFMGVLLTVYGAISAGGSVALLTELTPETFWPAVRRAGVTSAAMLNPTLADLLARPPADDDRDHPLTMMIGNAGDAARNVEAGRRFGVHWLAGLGKTEVCGAVSTGTDPHESEGVGRVVPPFFGRIVDPVSGADVAAGDDGELVLRCSSTGGLPAGYADDPEATAELWRGGWLHTGWRVRCDTTGCLHPIGDNSIHPLVIKRAGYMFAADLENEITAIADGVTATRVGTRPGNTDLDDPVVIAWVTGTLPTYEVTAAQLRAGLPVHLIPDIVVAVGELPRDPTNAAVAADAWLVGRGQKRYGR